MLQGSSGSPVSGGSGSHTVSPRTPRPPVMNRGTLRGLEGAKLAAALRHAATVAEGRHQCFEQASVPSVVVGGWQSRRALATSPRLPG